MEQYFKIYLKKSSRFFLASMFFGFIVFVFKNYYTDPKYNIIFAIFTFTSIYFLSISLYNLYKFKIKIVPWEDLPEFLELSGVEKTFTFLDVNPLYNSDFTALEYSVFLEIENVKIKITEVDHVETLKMKDSAEKSKSGKFSMEPIYGPKKIDEVHCEITYKPI